MFSHWFTLFFFSIGAVIGSYVFSIKDLADDTFSVDFFFIEKKRSTCSHCQKKLASHDLIPIISFLFLKGKCRYCKHKIPWESLFVELSFGFLFAYHYQYYGESSTSIFWLLLTSFVLILSWMDLYYLAVDAIFFSKGMLFLLLYQLSFVSIDSLHVATAFCFQIIFLCITFYFPDSLGLGDQLLITGFGLMLGLYATLVILKVACISAILIHYSAKFLKRDTSNEQTPIPFIPFLTFGLITLFYSF